MKRSKKIRTMWWALSFLLLSYQASAQTVFSTNGNIYLGTAKTNAVQITSSGHDREPSLSPDGKFIAYVHDVSVTNDSQDVFDSESVRELKVVSVETQKSETLIRGVFKDNFVLFGLPVWAPDGHSIYFLTSLAATSAGVRKVSLETKKVEFIIDGDTIELITKGEYTGYLLVDRHLIKEGKDGISLGRDVYTWIVSSDGKAIKEIGKPDEIAVETFRNEYVK